MSTKIRTLTPIRQHYYSLHFFHTAHQSPLREAPKSNLRPAHPGQTVTRSIDKSTTKDQSSLVTLSPPFQYIYCLPRPEALLGTPYVIVF